MLTWTIAYRTSTNRGIFHRVDDLHLSWGQSVQLGTYLAGEMGTSVWTVPTRQGELDGNVAVEDIANVMVDSGARIRIAEDGALPFSTDPTGDQAASTVAEVEDGGAGGWRWITFVSGYRTCVTLNELLSRVAEGQWAMTDKAQDAARRVARELFRPIDAGQRGQTCDEHGWTGSMAAHCPACAEDILPAEYDAPRDYVGTSLDW
jgi:hypothetical protein